MEHLQNLYYALGELIYAIAKSDGSFQKEEKNTIHEIISEELKKNNIYVENMELELSYIQKDDVPIEIVYQEALDEMKRNSFYLDSNLKKEFIITLEKIANAFPPTTSSEQSMIDRLKQDMKSL